MTATLNNEPLQWLRLTVPRRGVPTFEGELSSELDAPVGSVTITIAGTDFSGTVYRGGDFTGAKLFRGVLGAAGWRNALPAKGYGNPGGVALSTILKDAARECGETMGDLPSEIVGGHYARRSGGASQPFDLLAPLDDWWVDFAGVTQTGLRSSALVTDPDLQVLDHDPASGRLLLGVSDPSQMTPGRMVSYDSLPAPVTLDLLTFVVRGNEFRVDAWIA